MGGALFFWVLIVGTSLFLTHGLTVTAARLLDNGPALVVRRIGNGGWAPIPVKDALEAVGRVPGVQAARARVWGTTRTDDGVVTVMGVSDAGRSGLNEPSFRKPGPGEAVVGSGIRIQNSRLWLTGSGEAAEPFQVVEVLARDSDMVANDLVLLHESDARRVLGLSAGHATDLGVYVFHPGEASAMLPEMSSIFPWPVQLITREEIHGIYASGFSRRGGIALLVAFPGFLALALVLYGVVRERIGQRYQVGLLKAFGWTTRDIIRFQMYRALCLGMPAMTMGLAAAYWLVFFPGITWPGRIFLGWDKHPPALFLDPSGALVISVEVILAVLVPYIAAVLWPSLRSGAADPQDLIEDQKGILI